MLRRKTDISYFLLGKRVYFFINPFAKSVDLSKVFKKLIKYLPIYNFRVLLANRKELITTSTIDISDKGTLFIIMGGDGTINTAIQYLEDAYALIGIIPTGTANDLAREFKIPTKVKDALDIIKEGYYRDLDMIRVNNSYFLTVGGIGLPTVVSETVNSFKRKSGLFKFLHKRIFRGSIYKVFTFFLLLCGEKNVRYPVEVKVDGEEYYSGDSVAVFVGKQKYLGKYFLTCPNVSADDDHLSVSVLKYSGVFQALRDIVQISKGKTDKVKNFIYTSGDTFEIKTKKHMDFLGDGENLDNEIEFVGRRMHKALKMIVPRGADSKTRWEFYDEN